MRLRPGGAVVLSLALGIMGLAGLFRTWPDKKPEPWLPPAAREILDVNQASERELAQVPGLDGF